MCLLTCFFCCSCCCGPYTFALLAAIFIAIETFIFGSLNFFYILGYTCVIEPPDKEHLNSGGRFFENVWSWFIYSQSACEDRFGNDYEPPLWISNASVPDYFIEQGNFDLVAAYTGIYYQIVLFILNILWFGSCFVLIYGNARKLPKYYLPFLVLGVLTLFFDILFGSFYIGYWSSISNFMEGDDWVALFSMVFYYFKSFFLIIFNIVQIWNVFYAFRQASKKRRKQEKMKAKITIEVENKIALQTTESKTGETVEAGSRWEQTVVHAPVSHNTESTNIYPSTSNASQYSPVSNTYPSNSSPYPPTSNNNPLITQPIPRVSNPYPSNNSSYPTTPNPNPTAPPSYSPKDFPNEKEQWQSDRHKPFSYTNPTFRPDNIDDIKKDSVYPVLSSDHVLKDKSQSSMLPRVSLTSKKY